MAESTPLRVIEETPGYWRVMFDYPPFNVVDATMYQGLQDLLARMDASASLRVIVFESALPDELHRTTAQQGRQINVITGLAPRKRRY